MCIFGNKPPELKPLPPTPTAADKDVQARAAALQQDLQNKDGTAGSVKTDLVPSSLVGKRQVLLGL